MQLTHLRAYSARTWLLHWHCRLPTSSTAHSANSNGGALAASLSSSLHCFALRRSAYAPDAVSVKTVGSSQTLWLAFPTSLSRYGMRAMLAGAPDAMQEHRAMDKRNMTEHIRGTRRCHPAGAAGACRLSPGRGRWRKAMSWRRERYGRLVGVRILPLPAPHCACLRRLLSSNSAAPRADSSLLNHSCTSGELTRTRCAAPPYNAQAEGGNAQAPHRIGIALLRQNLAYGVNANDTLNAPFSMHFAPAQLCAVPCSRLAAPTFYPRAGMAEQRSLRCALNLAKQLMLTYWPATQEASAAPVRSSAPPPYLLAAGGAKKQAASWLRSCSTSMPPHLSISLRATHLAPPRL